MGQARTNRRIRKRMVMNNAHISGIGVSRYGKQKSKEARARREALDLAKALKTGRSFGFGRD